MKTRPSIKSLPTRYEPLFGVFGDKVKTTFVQNDSDLEELKRFISSADSAHQGKLLFLQGMSGVGKTTLIHSLEVFVADKIASVVRLPPAHELPVGNIPSFVAAIPVSNRHTVVNFDAREAPHFDEAEYRTFLVELNGILRTRHDVLVIWPVNDDAFAQRMVDLLRQIGGDSAFGVTPSYSMKGLPRDKFRLALEKLLMMANWTLDDAAVTANEADNLIAKAERVGAFLDDLHRLIVNRFDLGGIGIAFPNLVLAISSSEPKIRETCRSLRRADSYYIEGSRLLMYTKRSNVADWWQSRSDNLKSALPHVIALFNAQLVSVSASAFVHSILQHGTEDLKSLVTGVRADKGNARRVVESSELFKFVSGAAIDNREYGSSVKEDTYLSYDRVQALSDEKHKSINTALMRMVVDCGATMTDMGYEVSLVPGLQTDVAFTLAGQQIALELHHKKAEEATANKLAIYILEKLKEYAINYGLSSR